MKQFLFSILMTMPLMGFSQATTIQQNGMTFTWEVEGNEIIATVTGPLQGWLAVGFSDKPGIVGSNLLMMRVTEDGLYGEDQLVTGVRMHPTIESLEGQSGLLLLDGKESEEGTSIRFRMVFYEDPFHHQLIPGDICYLTLAYSVADEFDHHSRMRTETQIRW